MRCVRWLYIGDQDVVHIGQRNFSEHQNEYLKTPEQKAATNDPTLGSGRIDHVCFNCEGIEEFIARFEAGNVEFSERQAHSQALYQLFLREPINGIKVELNFPAEEAERAGSHVARTTADA